MRGDLCLVMGEKGGFSLNRSVVGGQLQLHYYKGVVELSNDWARCQQSFFVMSGEARVYQLGEIENGPKFNTQPQMSLRKTSRFYVDEEEERNTYLNIEAFLKQNRQYEMIQDYGQYRCLGPIFRQ